MVRVASWIMNAALRRLYRHLDQKGFAVVPKIPTVGMCLGMSDTAVNDHGVLLPACSAAEVWIEGILHAPKPPGVEQ